MIYKKAARECLKGRAMHPNLPTILSLPPPLYPAGMFPGYPWHKSSDFRVLRLGTSEYARRVGKSVCVCVCVCVSKGAKSNFNIWLMAYLGPVTALNQIYFTSLSLWPGLAGIFSLLWTCILPRCTIELEMVCLISCSFVHYKIFHLIYFNSSPAMKQNLSFDFFNEI